MGSLPFVSFMFWSSSSYADWKRFSGRLVVGIIQDVIKSGGECVTEPMPSLTSMHKWLQKYLFLVNFPCKVKEFVGCKVNSTCRHLPAARHTLNLAIQKDIR